MTRPENTCVNPANSRWKGGWPCATWQMIKHGDDDGNPVNSNRLKTMRHDEPKNDGIAQVDYKLVEKSVKFGGLFTYVLIDVHAPSLEDFNDENKGNAVWKNKRQWERDMKHFKSMMDTSSNAKAAALNNGKN